MGEIDGGSCRYSALIGKNADIALQDLRHLVSLTSIAPTLHGAQRVAIDRMIAELTERVGPVVPKRRAAAILDISTQALDEWIRRGRIRAEHRSTGSRAGVDTADLIWTAHQIPAGTARPGRVVDRARELARRREEFWRFNEAVELADVRAFAELPFKEQLRQIDSLSASMGTVLAMRSHNPAKETARAG